LAIATEKRLPEAPHVPTLKELGVNVTYAVTRGVMVPKGTPADLLGRLEDACTKATAEPKFAEDMAKQGTFVRFMDRKAYAEFLKQNDDLNKTLARDLRLLKRS
jgi:tripartite-type tricarboxylate transporter receptor subunit TctC